MSALVRIGLHLAIAVALAAAVFSVFWHIGRAVSAAVIGVQS